MKYNGRPVKITPHPAVSLVIFNCTPSFIKKSGSIRTKPGHFGEDNLIIGPFCDLSYFWPGDLAKNPVQIF